MKKTIFGFIILGIMTSAVISFNSCSCGRGSKEVELDDSTKLALEMERRLREEPEFEMVTSHGTMKLRLYSKTPLHRDPFSVIEPYLDKVDMVLVMTVQAGFGGQSFIEERLEMVKKVKELKEKNGYNYIIQLDGGVSPENIDLCVKAGLEVAVAGSAVFKAEDPAKAVKSMQVEL